MPSELDIILKGLRISKEDWPKLIKARVEGIKPHLDTFSLKVLGQLKFLRLEGTHTSELSWLGVEAETINDLDDGDVMDVQGLFWAPSSGQYSAEKPAFMDPKKPNIWYIYGLTRKGKWVLSEVEYYEVGGYKGRGKDVATKIVLKPTDIPTICKNARITPKEIWLNLGDAIMAWEESRRRSYQVAQRMAEEARIFGVIASHAK